MDVSPLSGPAAPVAAPVAAAPVAAAAADVARVLAVTVVIVGLYAGRELNPLSMAAQTRSCTGSRFSPTRDQMLEALGRLGVEVSGPNPVIVDCRPMARRKGDFPSPVLQHVGWHPVLCESVATHPRFPEVCQDYLAQWNAHADQWTRTVVLWCGQGRHRSVAFSRCVDTAVRKAAQQLAPRLPLQIQITWSHCGHHHGQWRHLCDLCFGCLAEVTEQTRERIQTLLVPHPRLPR